MGAHHPAPPVPHLRGTAQQGQHIEVVVQDDPELAQRVAVVGPRQSLRQVAGQRVRVSPLPLMLQPPGVHVASFYRDQPEWPSVACRK